MKVERWVTVVGTLRMYNCLLRRFSAGKKACFWHNMHVYMYSSILDTDKASTFMLINTYSTFMCTYVYVQYILRRNNNIYEQTIRLTNGGSDSFRQTAPSGPIKNVIGPFWILMIFHGDIHILNRFPSVLYTGETRLPGVLCTGESQLPGVLHVPVPRSCIFRCLFFSCVVCFSICYISA